MSSSQSGRIEIDKDEAKRVREDSIKKEVKEKIRYQVYKEMLLPDNALSAVDVGLGVNRQGIVCEVLKDLIAEIERISENSH